MRLTPQMLCIAAAGFLAGLALHDRMLTPQPAAAPSEGSIAQPVPSLEHDQPAGTAARHIRNSQPGMQRLRFPGGMASPGLANGTLLILSPVRNRYACPVQSYPLVLGAVSNTLS